MYALLLLLTACADPIVTTIIEDEGTVCLDGEAVVIQFPGCLSSSCDTLVSATCTADLQGSTLVVTGRAVIDSQGEECTADCGLISATCTTPTLPDEVVVQYAGRDGALEACTLP